MEIDAPEHIAPNIDHSLAIKPRNAVVIAAIGRNEGTVGIISQIPEEDCTTGLGTIAPAIKVIARRRIQVVGPLKLEVRRDEAQRGSGSPDLDEEGLDRLPFLLRSVR